MQCPRDELPDDLVMRLKQHILSHQRPDIDGQANPYSLDLIGRIWRQSLNGFIHLKNTNISITMCDGGLINPDEIPILEHALTQPGLSFVSNNSFGLGDWYTVGQILFNAARTRTREGFYHTHRKKVLKARPKASRTEQLPLSEGILPLLSDRRTINQPLSRRLASLKIDPAQIEQDLEVLWLLGLYRFQVMQTSRSQARRRLQHLPPPSRSGVSSRTVSLAISATSGISRSSTMGGREHTSNILRNQLEMKRLRREAESLESASDWTVLGIRPTSRMEEVEQAAQRMRHRYTKLKNQTPKPEVRALADKILLRLAEAVKILEKLIEVYTSFGPPELHDSREEQAFSEGFSALQRQDLSKAHRLFVAAYDEQMQSPRNIAFMAWTLLLLKGTNEQSKVLDYLQLSTSLRPDVAQTQYFLATAEAQSGDIDRAEQRLLRIIKRGHTSEEVKNLYRHLRSQRSSQRR
jgi:tetratricopeptide (TPR) repeat protein